MRSERTLQAFLFALVASPGLAGAVVLVVSFFYSASAIAAREHLGAFARVMPACSGCGLCGMSRAFAAMSHGEMQAAIDFNPGVLLVWPLMWVLVAVSAFGVYRLRKTPVRFFATSLSSSQASALKVQQSS